MASAPIARPRVWWGVSDTETGHPVIAWLNTASDGQMRAAGIKSSAREAIAYGRPYQCIQDVLKCKFVGRKTIYASIVAVRGEAP